MRGDGREMNVKILCCLLAMFTTVSFVLGHTACTAAPRVDISKSPSERTPLTPEETQKNKERQEKIEKEMEELEKKRKLEHDQNNQTEKKTGPKTATVQEKGSFFSLHGAGKIFENTSHAA